MARQTIFSHIMNDWIDKSEIRSRTELESHYDRSTDTIKGKKQNAILQNNLNPEKTIFFSRTETENGIQYFANAARQPQCKNSARIKEGIKILAGKGIEVIHADISILAEIGYIKSLELIEQGQTSDGEGQLYRIQDGEKIKTVLLEKVGKQPLLGIETETLCESIEQAEAQIGIDFRKQHPDAIRRGAFYLNPILYNGEFNRIKLSSKESPIANGMKLTIANQRHFAYEGIRLKDKIIVNKRISQAKDMDTLFGSYNKQELSGPSEIILLNHKQILYPKFYGY